MLEKSDLQQIRSIVKDEVSSQLKPINKSIKNLEADSRKTRRDIGIIISTFDNEYLDLRHRVDRIEENLGLTA